MIICERVMLLIIFSIRLYSSLYLLQNSLYSFILFFLRGSGRDPFSILYVYNIISLDINVKYIFRDVFVFFDLLELANIY